MGQVTVRICPECGSSFEAPHSRKQFCAVAHQVAYNNRQLARGQALVSLAQAWRGARSSKDKAVKAAASSAFTKLCRMLDEYNADDLKAGRLSAMKMLRRRDAHGLIDLA